MLVFENQDDEETFRDQSSSLTLSCRIALFLFACCYGALALDLLLNRQYLDALLRVVILFLVAASQLLSTYSARHMVMVAKQ